jgi:CRP-like cAMP-binding protein
MNHLEKQSLDKLFINCDKIEISKGTKIIHAGEYCHFFMFIVFGLIRQYTIDEKGKEHTIQFAPEHWFIGDRDSIYYSVPTEYYFEALEDTVFYKVDPAFIQQLSCKDSDFAAFNIRLLHTHIIHLQRRIRLLLSATAEERYLDFIQTYPDLMMRVSQVMIASYLGLAPESLSRVRKEIATKHKNKQKEG